MIRSVRLKHHLRRMISQNNILREQDIPSAPYIGCNPPECTANELAQTLGKFQEWALKVELIRDSRKYQSRDYLERIFQ